MNSMQSRFTSFLIIIQLASFNVLLPMQNQQPQQPHRGICSRLGSAIGGGIGGTIDAGVVRLGNWLTDPDYTVGTLVCRGLSVPCIAAAAVCTWKTIYASFEMAAIYNDWFGMDYRARTARDMKAAGKDFLKYGGAATAASVAALWLTNNPQRA